MKKLNLQLGSIKEMLTKEQMKKVAGGYGDDGGCGQADIKCAYFSHVGPPHVVYHCAYTPNCNPWLADTISSCLNDCEATYGIDCQECGSFTV